MTENVRWWQRTPYAECRGLIEGALIFGIIAILWDKLS